MPIFYLPPIYPLGTISLLESGICILKEKESENIQGIRENITQFGHKT